MWKIRLYFLVLSVVFLYVMIPNFWSPLILSHYLPTSLLMKHYLYALTSSIVVHQLLSFLFQRTFLLSFIGNSHQVSVIQFQWDYASQIGGVSMGSSLSPILVNIFVGFHERLLFEKFPKPFIYLRYVDDTFVSFSSRNDALLFFH